MSANFAALLSDGVGPYAATYAHYGWPWFFHHIPKTAGTSLIEELDLVLPPYRNIHIPPGSTAVGAQRDAEMKAAIEAFVAHDREVRCRSASGHLPLLDVIAMQALYPGLRLFSILRDPVERVVSDYRYSISDVHPAHEDARRRYPSIEAYADDPANQNKMWWFLAQGDRPADDGHLREAMLRYNFIGTVETLDRDFAFVTGLVGCPRVPTARANQTRASKANEVTVDPALRDRIRTANARDVELYEAVRDGLARRDAEMRAFIERRRAVFAA